VWKEIVIDRKIIIPEKRRDEIDKRGLTDYFNPDEIVFFTSNDYQLYNVQTWNKVTDLDLGYFIPTYAWSPDLSTFYIAPYFNDAKNFYLFRNDKVFLSFNISQLNTKVTGLAVQNYDSFSSPIWAPDSKKFLTQTITQQVIMNLDRLTATILCVDDKALDGAWSDLSVWSPDSRFLIYYNYGNGGDSKTMLIDTEKWRAYRLALKYDLDVIGWLASQ
jgi:hypothetical protein